MNHADAASSTTIARDGSAAPAGWYDDPTLPGQHRYWDGSEWTAHTAVYTPAEPIARDTAGA